MHFLKLFMHNLHNFAFLLAFEDMHINMKPSLGAENMSQQLRTLIALHKT